MIKMPNLTGSEKQIAWAEKIRAMFVRKFEDMVDDYNETVNDKDEGPEFIEQYKARRDPVINTFREMLKTVDNASWYIDHRDSSIDSTIKLFKTGSIFGKL